MTLGSAILALHIAFGSIGLALGPIAMSARKRPGLHTNAGEFYHWNMFCLCITAGGLALLNWERNWWFLPLAIFSYAFALLGYLAAKLRWHNWLRWHVAGQGGSYIAMTTALLVVNLGIQVWWAWALPTIVGSPIIAWVSREIALGRRPLLT
jgi:hypothetical protein